MNVPRIALGPTASRLVAQLRARPWAWGVPLALLLINLVVFLGYRARFAGRADTLVEQVEKEQQELQQVQALVTRARRSVDRVLAADEGLENLYEHAFATEEERFTTLLREVRRLAVESGLKPTDFRYPESELEDFGLLQRGITFSVEGTYDQLRTFINFLELSEQFVVLQALGLSQGAQNRLRISLEISTLFSGRDLTVSVARESGRTGS